MRAPCGGRAAVSIGTALAGCAAGVGGLAARGDDMGPRRVGRMR